MSNPLQQTIEALAKEKGIEPDVVISAIEEAVATASRKYYKTGENLKTRFNTETGQVDLFALKTVVEEVTTPATEIEITEPREVTRTHQGDGVANSTGRGKGRGHQDPRGQGMGGTEGRGQTGQHGDAAKDCLQQDADEWQDRDPEQGAASRCPPPYRDDHQQRRDADDTGEGPVAELDDLVKPLRLVGNRGERSRDALGPGRAAETRTGQAHEPARDHDADLEDPVDQEGAA